MKKRVLAGLMMTVMVLASAMSVSAASKEKPIEEVGSQKGYYEVTPLTNFEDVTDATVKAQLEKLNKGEAVSVTTDVDKAIKGKKLVQKFFDMRAVGQHPNCTNGHTVTLKVDAMTDKWKNITVVHYSTARTTWEVFSGNTLKVDYDKSTLTFTVEDFSPFAIYADIVEEGSSGTSPSTQGVSSTWMLYAAMALIVLGSGVVVYQKKRG